MLMMCGNFGLVGNAEAAALTLRRLHTMTSPRGRIVLDSVDPYVDADAERSPTRHETARWGACRAR